MCIILSIWLAIGVSTILDGSAVKRRFFACMTTSFICQTLPNTLPFAESTAKTCNICNCLSQQSLCSHRARTLCANKYFSLPPADYYFINYSFFTLTAAPMSTIYGFAIIAKSQTAYCPALLRRLQFHRHYIDVAALTHRRRIFCAGDFPGAVDGFRLVLQFWRELQWHCWRKVRAITPSAKAVWTRKERVDSLKYLFSIATTVCSNRETLPFIRESF